MSDVTAKDMEIIRLLQAPMTMQQIADEIGYTYHGARKIVKSLEERGFVKQQPFRKNNEILWIATSDEDFELKFVVDGKTLNGIAVTGAFSNFDTGQGSMRMKVAAGALAHIVLDSWHAANGTVRDVAGEPVECQKAFFDARTYLKEIVSLMDQVITAPIWSRDPEIYKNLGYSENDMRTLMPILEELDTHFFNYNIKGELPE